MCSISNKYEKSTDYNDMYMYAHNKRQQTFVCTIVTYMNIISLTIKYSRDP